MNQPPKDLQNLTPEEKFKLARDKFIVDYLNNSFKKDIQKDYGNLMNIVKIAISAGIGFTKLYYNIKD